MKLRLAVAIAFAFVGHAAVARAECTDAGACASNQYCATSAGDAGVVVTDGGAGVCLPEPCVISSDCPNGDLCDTAEEPHECIGSPTPGDGGTDATVDDDGGETDAGEAIDATLPTSTPDASSDANEPAPPESEDAGPDTGSLAGGACDCSLAAPRDASVAAFGSVLLLGIVAFVRRGSRRRR